MKTSVYKIPLLIKVVSLYLFISIPIVVAQQMLGPAQTAGNVNTPAIEVATVPEPASDNEVIAGKPVQLVIPRLDVDLTIEDGKYHADSETWTLHDHNAHYAVMTAQPSNQPGHTMLYGHNTRRVLAATEDIQPGDEMLVKTNNGHTFTYTYIGDEVVMPDDTAFLQEAHESAEEPVLTLLTCDGPWFEKRRLMSFALTEVE